MRSFVLLLFVGLSGFFQCVASRRTSGAANLANASNQRELLGGQPPPRIRVVLVEGTRHPGRGDDGYYLVPLHVDFWRHAMLSLKGSHQIPELSVSQGNVIIDPVAYDADMLPHALIARLGMNPSDFSNPGSVDPLFAHERDAKGAITEHLKAFADSLSPEDISILIFTGHGLQINGELHLLFANPLFPEIKKQVPWRVWKGRHCRDPLGQYICISYDELKQIFDGKGRLSVHIIGACRVTRDPSFNLNSFDSGDPVEARRRFLSLHEDRQQPANVVTLFGTAPGSETWHGDGQDLGERLDSEGRLDSVYTGRLKADAAVRSSPLKFRSSFFQERVVSALGKQCATSEKDRPTVLSWLREAARDPIERTENFEGRYGNSIEKTYTQIPDLEWGGSAEAAAQESALVFDQEKCFDPLEDA